MRYDILFRDVILGGKTVSIAISGNRFAAIGELPDAGADKVIECGGKFAAAPYGFIFPPSHCFGFQELHRCKLQL